MVIRSAGSESAYFVLTPEICATRPATLGSNLSRCRCRDTRTRGYISESLRHVDGAVGRGVRMMGLGLGLGLGLPTTPRVRAGRLEAPSSTHHRVEDVMHRVHLIASLPASPEDNQATG